MKKQIAIITGAGSGIGKGIAEKLALQGYETILLARKSKEINRLSAKIKKNKGTALSMTCDIKNEKLVNDTIKKIHKKYGHIEVLINSAASGPVVDPSDKLSLEDWKNVIDTDLTGTFLVCRSVGKIMIKAKYGRIVNISSFHSIATYPQRVAYASAKTGVIGLTRALALEWAKYGITVNAISPGPIKTPRTNWFLNLDPKNESLMLARTPMGRLGEVNDVSSLAEFLVSKNNGFITGQNIVIDGGWTSSAWFGNYSK